MLSDVIVECNSGAGEGYCALKRRSLSMAASRAGSSAWASSGEEDVTMGILGHEGEPGVDAGSEEARCRRRAAKESMKTL